ncbi:MAG: CPBP family intramembrane metalloprotease [Phycisphaerae bacterium]|nr:CPBP family intramembrane metalloprotease [Phycisphaerae bacterium]MCZ2401581.1 CPBP family intramembrane metalloprotease [Phycisphaerae bacterium]
MNSTPGRGSSEQNQSPAAPGPASAPTPPPLPTARPLGPTVQAPAPTWPPAWAAWQREIDALPRRAAALDLLLVLMTAIIFHYLPQVLLLEHLEADAGPPPAAVLIVGKWCEALLAAGLVMYLVLRHGLPARVFGLRTDGLGVQSVWSLAGLAGCYAGLLATGVVILLFYLAYPDMKKELAERMEFIKALPRDNTLVMLALLVPVAVHEELVFRGLLMPYLRRLTGKWWSALLVSALIFGALHIPGQGLVGGLQTTVVGCVLGLVFIVSRSLLAVALAHLLFNFAQLQIIRFVSQYAEFAPLGG